MKTWTIYKHTNKLNGKVYVGQTTKKVSLRWKNGEGYCKQPKFYGAIQKYTWDGFKHEIIGWASTEELALAEEAFQIQKYDSVENGYNVVINPTKHFRLGTKHSEETKRKISRAHMGRVAYNKGKPMSEEQKKKCLDAKIWFKKGQKAWNKGQKRSCHWLETRLSDSDIEDIKNSKDVKRILKKYHIGLNRLRKIRAGTL